MPTLISLLRGINVGGHRKIKMAELRALYEALGFLQIRTLLQSGNAIFVTEERDLLAIQGKIESGIRSEFGFDVQVIMRGAEDLMTVLDQHPFQADQLQEPGKLAVVFLSEGPADESVSALIESNPGRETIQARGREIFIHYPDGMARSKLNNQFLERRLGVSTTARNWNTCQRLLKLLGDYQDQLSCST